MSEIKRTVDPPDGVAAEVMCAVIHFDREAKQNGAPAVMAVKKQSTVPCNILCAYSEGTVSVSIPDSDMMVVVRIDEMFSLLKAASIAAQELQESLPPEAVDAEIETRFRELDGLEWYDADSPSGKILAAGWWIFPQGADREDIVCYMAERHSKGRGHLFQLV
jgi:hypothetical protein